MTDVYNSRGWRNRLRASAARDDEQNDVERLEIRRERQKLYDAQAAADEAAREAHRVALEAERCACPACAGSGRVTVEVAAGLLDAWHRYKFHEYKPSQSAVAALAAIARGDAPPPGSPVITASYGFSVPGPEMISQAATVAPVADPETVEPPKPSRPAKVSKPSEDHFTSDGALIEI